MIKLVKFNLLIGGQRCRTIEDLRNNFNILNVMEEFQKGKLEKWLKVRKFDEYESIKEIDKTSDDLEIANSLCRILSIGKEYDKSEFENIKSKRAREYMEKTIHVTGSSSFKSSEFGMKSTLEPIKKRKGWFK